MSKRYLLEVNLRLIKRVIVEAETADEAIENAATISAESLALGEADDALILGDEPPGHGSGSVELIAEEDTEDWSYHVGGIQ